jgi:hypothetical protein
LEANSLESTIVAFKFANVVAGEVAQIICRYIKPILESGKKIDLQLSVVDLLRKIDLLRKK